MWLIRARRRPRSPLVVFMRLSTGDRWSRETFCSSKAKNSRLPAAAQGTAASVALKHNEVPLQVPHSAKCVKIPDERLREREKDTDQPSAAAAAQMLPEIQLHPPQANEGGPDVEKCLVGAN